MAVFIVSILACSGASEIPAVPLYAAQGNQGAPGDNLDGAPGTMQLGEMGKMTIRVKHMADNPIIRPDMEDSPGSNINGPTLIRVPEWVEQPPGKYYLYFADHKGKHIRLAYASRLIGPWTIYGPGSLQLGESHFLTGPPDVPDTMPSHLRMLATIPRERLQEPREPHVPSIWDDLTQPHIASPDVHVDHKQKVIRMYYHGLDRFGYQVSRMAISQDGISFVAREEVIVDKSYLKAIHHNGWSMPW